MSKKTILYFITQSEMGGAQAYVFDLAKNLQGEYKVLVAFGEQGKNGYLAKKLDKKNIKYFTLPHLKRAISPINDFLSMLEIIKLIKKTKPNIIHLNSSKISILGSLAALFIIRQKPRIIYTAHGWVFNEPLPTWKKLFYKYAEKITSFNKNKIICVSEFDRQVAIKEKIVVEEKLITIHNGVAPVNFLEKDKARKKILKHRDWNFNIKDEIIIGSIGNVYKTKGFEYLIEASKILISKGFNIKTIIMSKAGPERKNLVKLIEQENLENKILLSQVNPPAAGLLKALDIYVCSSVKEGLSYTIIEAMQASLPIVATRVGGNPELIKNNESGLLINSKNPTEIAEAIKKIINNPKLKNKFGSKAKKNARENFLLEQMVKKTKKTYL